jgi:hypothetical protein
MSGRGTLLYTDANLTRRKVVALSAIRIEPTTIVISSILLLSLALAGYDLWIGLKNPIIDFFGFRQTQTAISAYWIQKGGPWLAYETPVLGAPWSIPFEFPVYQLLTALVASSGLPLDVAGRLVSFAFFIGALAPLWLLLRSFGFRPSVFAIIGAIYISAPIYAFWGRTVMIESAAVFFGLSWLAFVAAYLKRPNFGLLVVAIACGCLAVLTKSTTFPGFGILGGLFFAASIFYAWRRGSFHSRLNTFVKAFLACALPLAVGFAWLLYSDAVKAHNPFGAGLTQAALPGWYHGTIAQRLSLQFWRDAILERAGPDIFGYSLILVPLIIGAGLTSRRHAVPILLSAVAFLTPLLLFTNLHLIHNYYQTANAIFALAAVGFSIAALLERNKVIATCALACVLLGQWAYFRNVYIPIIESSRFSDDSDRYEIGLLAKSLTSPSDGLLVLGDTFSSEIPYYAERKSLVLYSAWATPNRLAPVISGPASGPQSYLGGASLGAIIECTGREHYSDEITQFLKGRRVLAEAGHCRILSPGRAQNGESDAN